MDSYSEFLYDRVNLHSGFAVHNGMKITHISKDRVVGEMPITPESLNPLGLVHGGCLAALADSVAGTAVYVHGRVCVTLNCSFNYLRPASGTLIRCVGTVQKLGSTIAVCDVVLTDDQDQAVASGCFTFFRKEEYAPGFPPPAPESERAQAPV